MYEALNYWCMRPPASSVVGPPKVAPVKKKDKSGATFEHLLDAADDEAHTVAS